MNPRIAHLKIEAPSGATVLVDGEALHEVAPMSDVYDVEAGAHVVRASSENAAGETKVTAPEGVETPVRVAFAAPSSSGHVVEPPKSEERTRVLPPPTGAIVLGGVGLVGLGMGVGFGLGFQSNRDDFDAHNCTTMTDPICTDSKNAGQRDATISWISYIAGGALLAGGVVWWIVAPRKETVSVSLVPSFDPSEPSLRLHGTF